MSVSKLTRAYLSNASAFIAVILFLMCGGVGPGDADVRWDTAYVISSILCTGHMLWLFESQPGHRIAVGSCIIHRVAILGSGTRRCPVVAGVGATWFSPLGFVGEASSDQALVRQFYVMLLIAAAFAVAVSLIYRHNTLLGGVLPIIVLELVRRQLQKRTTVKQ